MDLHHFFEGTMRREEVASAYLATLLQYNPAFRREFLAVAFEKPDFTDVEEWRVAVEEAAVHRIMDETESGAVDVAIDQATTSPLAAPDSPSGPETSERVRVTIDLAATGAVQLSVDASTARPVETTVNAPDGRRVDVVMESTSALVIIENKLSSGAVSNGQLLHYYERAVLAWPKKQIVAVYLAPKGVGHDEVDAVKLSQAWADHPGDHAVHIDWEQKVPALLSKVHADDWFAHTGVQAINRAIRRRRDILSRGAFPVVGERLVIRRIIIEASDELSRRPEFAPTGVVHGDNVQLTVLSRFSLSNDVKKTSDLARRWKKMEAIPSVEVPGVGHYARSGKWFERQVEWVGSMDAAPGYLAATGDQIIEFVRPVFLESPEGA